MSESRGTGGDHETIERITVVGGGDAGLMTALILKELNPRVALTVIDDFDEGIPEVGKSTITYILRTLHEFLGIDTTRFVSAVRPVWKASVYFEDWCGRDSFHVPFDGQSLQPSDPGRHRFETWYERYATGNFRTLGTEIVEQRVSPFVEDGDFYRLVAYHLNANRFNAFLREVCEERQIELINDEITEVRTNHNRIARIASETTEYFESDLYVDATGFERLLMGKLDNTFTPFDFPLDSAVVATADVSPAEIVPATVITSGDHGWFWQIDTYDCRDLGYVYSSDHVSDGDALSEFVSERDEDISKSDAQRFRFDSGVYEKAWVSNCVAVGNALGFVEPLQSTALTVNAQLSEKLSELIADHNRINHRGVRKIYNAIGQSAWNNVYDFISVHYLYSSGDNKFWDSMQSISRTANVDRYVATYRENGFNSFNEFDGRTGPALTVFDQYLFNHLLCALGVESDFYEERDIDVQPEVKAEIEAQDEQIVRRANDLLSYEDVYQKELFN